MTTTQPRLLKGTTGAGQFTAPTHTDHVVTLPPPAPAEPAELDWADTFRTVRRSDSTDPESTDWTNYTRFTTYKPTPAAAVALRRLLGLPEGSRAPVTISRHEYGSGDGWALDEAGDTVEVWSGKLKFELENEEPMERFLARINHGHIDARAAAQALIDTPDSWRRCADVHFDDGTVEELQIDEMPGARLLHSYRSKMRFAGPDVIIVNIVQQDWCKA